MPTDREKLRATLIELRAQLAGVDRLDPEVDANLRETLARILTVLNQDPLAPPSQPSLTGRLREAAVHFEETHPALTTTIGSLIDAVGRMGI